MRRIVTLVAALLLLLQVLLVMVSWLLSATMVSGVRPLLSAEGLRWFAGHFSMMLLTPQLSWLLLLSMSWGCLQSSGLLSVFSGQYSYRQRLGLRVVAVLVALALLVVLLLTVTPHAVLLSATGGLWPSPFSAALIPLLAFLVAVISSSYGLIVRRFKTLQELVFSFVSGLAQASPLIFLYVMAVVLFRSVVFVFF